MKRLFFAVAAIVAALSSGCGKSQDLGKGEVKVYLQAEETDWDYAPKGFAFYSSSVASNSTFHAIKGAAEANFPLYATQKRYTSLPTAPEYTSDPLQARIGSAYKKYHFVRYRNDSFSDKETIPTEEKDLGILGPVIRAEEADTLTIVFRDKTATGIRLQIDGLGAPDSEETSGNTTTYVWKITSDKLLAVNTNLDQQRNPAKPFVYQAEREEDREAGLVGPLVVYAKGLLGGSGSLRSSVKGIDREHFVLFKIFDENSSRLLAANINEYAGGLNAGSNPAGLETDPGFQQSNIKYTINGYMFGNQPPFPLKRQERTLWHILGGPFENTKNLVALPNGWDYTGKWDTGGALGRVQLPPGSGVTVWTRPSDVIDRYLLYSGMSANDFAERGMFAFYDIKQP